ncbi:prolyl aminopeptidase [Calocera cornea HHB12733]|uniref:Prolyl aminopeptidase n=1 Tax=Calocera cornea HHB12733 TaxID=1353952 RepID=A0A165IVB3_9BASI|nr:prolyl aminopeptidase [Calocera cornea HHB12733]
MDQYKPTSKGNAPFRTWHTSYEVYGTLPSPTAPGPAPGPRPLILLHGGPGIPGRCLLPITGLAKSHGIPVVIYDQLGCGASTHLRDKGADFWTVRLFLDELENLLAALGIAEYDVLGHSWGAMLAAEHALTHPPGLRRLVLSDGLASMPLWEQNALRLLGTMPPDVQAVIRRCEAAQAYEDDEYKAATLAFFRQYVCRLWPLPVEFTCSLSLLEEDPTVYTIMAGHSEITIQGTLKHWDITPRLGEITAPTLVLNGRYDEASDPVVQPLVDGIPRAKWVQFAHSSHTPFLEERERYAEVVGGWLLE